MRFTDLVHPAARPRDRRQPGHPDRRAAVDPLAHRAAVPAQRHRRGQRDDRLRRRQRRPRARLHHHAARARDRERRRHRLHGVVERPGRRARSRVHLKLNYDTNAALTQIQAKVGAGAQRPAARGRRRRSSSVQTADAQFAAMYLGFSSERPRPEPDHRLPDARRSAASSARSRGVQRADILGSRTFAMRDLAQARPHGGALGLSPSRCGTRWRRTTTCRRSGATKGSMVSVEPGRQHRPRDGRGVPPARRQAGRSGDVVRLGRDRRRRARAPRTTTRTSASTARPPPSWASGCCRPPTRSTSSSACARR